MPPRILPPLLVLLISALIAAADDFACSTNNQISGHEYDLSGLNVVKTVERTRITPPTTMIDSLSFNICADLELNDSPAGDQCPAGSRACLTKTNRKDDQDRIISVIPVATKAALDPKQEALTGSDKPGIKLLFHGDAYPEGGVAQSLSVTLICSSEAAEPTFISYENGVAAVEWSTPAGCAKTTGENPPVDDTPIDPNVPSGSGVGWFFLLFFLSLGAYFAIGAYHNYTNYGASGWDLIPHRDFWRDTPFLLRDLVQHLLGALWGGPSRGGYHAV